MQAGVVPSQFWDRILPRVGKTGISRAAKGVSPGKRPNPIPAPEGAAQPVSSTATHFHPRRVRRGLSRKFSRKLLIPR